MLVSGDAGDGAACDVCVRSACPSSFFRRSATQSGAMLLATQAVESGQKLPSVPLAECSSATALVTHAVDSQLPLPVALSWSLVFWCYHRVCSRCGASTRPELSREAGPVMQTPRAPSSVTHLARRNSCLLNAVITQPEPLQMETHQSLARISPPPPSLQLRNLQQL